MIASESVHNPIILAAARQLLDAGDAALRQAALELPPVLSTPAESTAP